MVTSKDAIYRAKESFSGQRKDRLVTIQKGELLRGNHEAVKLFPEFFDPIDNFDRPAVEAATAGPGEKRGA